MDRTDQDILDIVHRTALQSYTASVADGLGIEFDTERRLAIFFPGNRAVGPGQSFVNMTKKPGTPGRIGNLKVCRSTRLRCAA